METSKLEELLRKLPINSGLDPRLIEAAKTELNVLKFRAGFNDQSHKQKPWSKSDIQRLQDELKEKDAEIVLLRRQSRDRNRFARASEPDSVQQIQIKDKYKHLYDREWADAFDFLKKEGWNEIEIIVTLQRILRASYSFCQDVAQEQLENIEGEALYPSATWMDDDGIITRLKQRQITQEIYEIAKLYQRTTAKECLSALQKTFTDHVLPTFVDPTRYMCTQIQNFTRRCVEITWSMCIQDPPMCFIDRLDRGAKFDSDTFRKYNDGGNKFDYLVWPALLLHRDGPLITKGIAQPIQETLLENFDARVRSRQSISRSLREELLADEKSGHNSWDPDRVARQESPTVRMGTRGLDKNVVPRSPYFAPHSSQMPTMSPEERAALSSREIDKARTVHTRDGYQNDDIPEKLTVLWKNKKDERSASAS